MKKILVSVSNDISNDQRLFRTCQTLWNDDFDIYVVGREKKDSEPIDLHFKTKRVKMLFHKGFLFYAFFNLRLFFFLFFTKKDILYANDLDTLLPNYLVSKLQNKPLFFDSHELFSEVPELEHNPFAKKVWQNIENWIIPKLKHVITVSEGIKNHYQKKHTIRATVIRNVPPITNNKKKELDFISKKQKVIWYQGSVNLGRGLELVIDTISFLEDTIFIIVGDGDVFEKLEQKVLHLELEQKVKFLGKLPPNELRKLTSNATVGISLEEDLGLNYKYALPNKLFDYIHAEVPVIVSNLPDMAALVSEYKIGEVLKTRTPKGLTELILSMEKKDYSKALQKAKKELHWEQEKVKLLKLLKSV